MTKYSTYLAISQNELAFLDRAKDQAYKALFEKEKQLVQFSHQCGTSQKPNDIIFWLSLLLRSELRGLIVSSVRKHMHDSRKSREQTCRIHEKFYVL